MKFKAVIFTLVLVLSLGIPVFANVTIDGKIGAEMDFQKGTKKTDQWDWETYTKMNMGVHIEFDDNDAFANIELRGIEKFSSEYKDTFSLVPSKINVDQAYLQVKTALWPNGPAGNLRIGRQFVSFPLFETIADFSGIAVNDLTVEEGLDAQVAYLWGDSGTVAAGRPMVGLSLSKYAPDGTGLVFSVLNNEDRRNVGFAASLKTQNGKMQAEAGGVYDAERNQKRFVNLSSALTDHLMLRYNYSDIENGFRWLYPVRDIYDEDEDGSTYDYVEMEYGQKTEMSLEIRDYGALLSYERHKNGKDVATTVSAEKLVRVNNHPFIAKYKHEKNGSDVTQTFGGVTVVDFGTIRDVELSTEYVKGPHSQAWGIDAMYAAASGMELRFGYGSDSGLRFGSSFVLEF